jgi:hypothetical protein
VKRTAPAFVVAVFLLAVACGEPGTQTPGQRLLFLRSVNGVALIEPGGSKPVFEGRDSVPNHDWTRIVQTKPYQGGTRITSVDPLTSEATWAQDAPGRLRVKTVSSDGRVAALAPARQVSYFYGRKQTRFTIVRDGATTPQSLILEGNYEPEAFSTDTQSLFVVSYLPPRAPTKYQVRRLDLNTGKVKGVYTPHEELQEAMGGTARIQESSPDGKRLYTLYTVGGGENRSAFIHVLSLDELWAHCIALPPEFARGPEKATALVTSPDGRRLYVVNAAADAIAEIDTESLAVSRTASVDLSASFHLSSGGSVHAAFDSESRLIIGSGQAVTVVDTSDLIETDSWLLDENVTGLQESEDAAGLYVGFKKAVEEIDLNDGATLDRVESPGVGRIEQLGPEAPPLEEVVPKELQCAC